MTETKTAREVAEDITIELGRFFSPAQRVFLRSMAELRITKALIEAEIRGLEAAAWLAENERAMESADHIREATPPEKIADKILGLAAKLREELK